MIKAITAILLGFVVIAAIWFLPAVAFRGIVLLVVAVGAYEFANMFFKRAPEKIITVLFTILCSISIIWYPVFAAVFPLILSAILFLFCVFFMWRAETLDGVAQKLGLVMLCVFYLGVSFPVWTWIRDLSFGPSLVLLALVPACLCDTVAYIVGKTIGRHKFAPKVSPNKTWEGFAGALVGSLAGAFFIKWLLLPYIDFVHVLGLSLVIWITSPIGDLVESMLKRSCGVKDSGTIVPGHGGVLDRLDALIFTGPAAFAYIRFLIM